MGDETGLIGQQGPAADDEKSLGFILRLSAPAVATTITFTMMQFVDRIMVSRLGTAQLAAVLPAGFAANIPGAFAQGVFVSIAAYVSQCLGRGDKKQCASYWWQAGYMGLVFALAVLAACWPAAYTIFNAIGHEPEVVEQEVIYFRIMLIANVIGVWVWTGSQFFMGIHRPIVSMYASLTAQIVNIIANYLLIFGKFGFPKMGIAGAAWGTVLGVFIGGAIRTAVFFGPKHHSEYATRHAARIDFSKIRQLLKVGIPAGLELTLNTATWGSILFWLVGRFGKEAQAATSAALACTSISIMPIEGLKVALTAAVGKSIGARRNDVAIMQTGHCLRIALVYMGLIGLGILILPGPLMRLWSMDDKVVEIGTKVLIFAALYQVFYAARTIYSGALRGAGDTLWLAIVSGFGAVLILGVGGLAMIMLLPGWASLGPWVAATISIVAVGLANYARFKSDKWKKIDLFRKEAVSVPEQ